HLHNGQVIAMQQNAELINETISIESMDIEQLWHLYKHSNNPEAKNRLLLNYVPLVKQVVRRMMPRYNNYNEYDDLVNCGVIGLIDAVEKFDLQHGVKFETYAVNRIRGEALDYMREQDWAPSSLRKKINAIAEVYEAYENRRDAVPTDQEVADVLGVSVTDVRKTLSKNHAFNLLYFDDTLAGGYSLNDVSIEGESSTPENMLLKEEMKHILADIIASLPEKERLVITLYYYEELMFKEIAEILHVSESRVSQIHSKVLLKMRMKLKKIT
ncbi:MAG: FliA/WhiG family RNA polymerase sigma factor, partial [Clostridiales bacterium]|nr:FliA/WhiG family RNA polymerase sigma factor [Clostridiales bacterium]